MRLRSTDFKRNVNVLKYSPTIMVKYETVQILWYIWAGSRDQARHLVELGECCHESGRARSMFFLVWHFTFTIVPSFSQVAALSFSATKPVVSL